MTHKSFQQADIKTSDKMTKSETEILPHRYAVRELPKRVLPAVFFTRATLHSRERYMVRSRVCPSVCLSQAAIPSKRQNDSRSGKGNSTLRELSPTTVASAVNSVRPTTIIPSPVCLAERPPLCSTP